MDLPSYTNNWLGKNNRHAGYYICICDPPFMDSYPASGLFCLDIFSFFDTGDSFQIISADTILRLITEHSIENHVRTT